MKARCISLLAALGAVLSLVACAQTPATPPKVQFPEKGRAITIISPFPGGGATDIQARLLAPHLETELGVPVQVVNKPGAGGQVGVTELVRSKPDGHTIACLPDIVALTPYMDPSRGAVYSRKDLAQIAMQTDLPHTVAVKTDSPFKTPRDIVEAAKAKSEKVRVGTAGYMNDSHLAGIHFQRVAGVKFAYVHFDGFAKELPALLAGDIDAMVVTTASVASLLKSGQVRLLGVMSEQRFPYLPDEKTFVEQGYSVVFPTIRGYTAPGGTPREIIDILAKAIKKSMENEDVEKKMAEAGMPTMYRGPAEYAALVDQLEATLKPLVEQALEEARGTTQQ